MTRQQFDENSLPGTLAHGFNAMASVLREHATSLDNLDALSGGNLGAMVFNVKSYGALGDNSTSDMTAIAAALAAARTWVTNNSGQRAVVYFPAGRYVLRRVSTERQAIDLSTNTHTGITFLGDGDERSVLVMTGSMLGGTFSAIKLANSTSDIEFRNLTFQAVSITNPDNSSQNHLVQITGPVADIRFTDCVFRDSYGDGIQHIGNPGQWVDRLWVDRCRFLNCGRSGIEFQRFTRNSKVMNCYFSGGHDQMIDFEPTGFTFVGDASGCTTTVLKCATAHFQTWGWVAGMPIKNETQNVTAYIVSVDSETQVTTTAVPSVWTSNLFYEHNVVRPQFVGCTLDNSAGVSRIIWTVEACFKPLISNCRVLGGTILLLRTYGAQIHDCSIYTGTGDGAGGETNAAIGIQAGCDEISLRDLDIVVRGDTRAMLRLAISSVYGSGEQTTSLSIHNVHIRAECATSNLFRGVKRLDIDGFTVIKAGSDTDTQNAITIDILGFSPERVSIRNFRCPAEQGRWWHAVSVAVGNTLSCGPVEIHGFTTTTDCKYALQFVDHPLSPGLFDEPPQVSGSLNGATAVVDGYPSAVPWVRISGAAHVPSIYQGTGDPNTVLDAVQGSMALRLDGGAGTTLYVKESASSKVWAAK